MTRRYPCRCSRCGARRSLKLRPQDYLKKPPKCLSCGYQKYRIDKYRLRVEMATRNTCTCGGLYFPHRKGTKYCDHSPTAQRDQTERYDNATQGT